MPVQNFLIEVSKMTWKCRGHFAKSISAENSDKKVYEDDSMECFCWLYTRRRKKNTFVTKHGIKSIGNLKSLSGTNINFLFVQ